MEQLFVTVEDVKNELDISLAEELQLQPKQVDRWLMRVQRTILNHIARYAYGGMEKVRRLIRFEKNLEVVREAIIEQIDYLATNNFVQADKVMNTGGGQLAEPVIAPLAHQVLLNAGLLYTGAYCR